MFDSTVIEYMIAKIIAIVTDDSGFLICVLPFIYI